MNTVNTVKIVGKADGTVVNAYAKNPKFGYVQLQQTSMTMENGWVRENKKSCLLRGDVDQLQKFVAAYAATGLPGNIVTREFVQSEVPSDVSKMFINPELYASDPSAAIAGYVKTAGDGGVPLTRDGEVILRFSQYDPSGLMQDTRVQHDNVEAVATQRAAEKAAQSVVKETEVPVGAELNNAKSGAKANLGG